MQTVQSKAPVALPKTAPKPVAPVPTRRAAFGLLATAIATGLATIPAAEAKPANGPAWWNKPAVIKPPSKPQSYWDNIPSAKKVPMKTNTNIMKA